MALQGRRSGFRSTTIRLSQPAEQNSGGQIVSLDQEKLMIFLGQFVGDLGATIAAGSVVVGDRLGLYRALAEGPATAHELAQRTETDTRYVTEWLRGQAAGGYVMYDAASDTYSLTEEQSFA